MRDLGRDTGRDGFAPHDLTDLVDELAVRDDTVAGEVSVAFVTGADGRRRAIVDVPGTKSWSPGRTDDVTSLSTNARALVGASTTYEHGVLDAMTRAGVTHTDQVMLVGHSEGGMVAVTAARDAVRTGRFDVTHVVTAGSPIARSVGDLPESVRVLALENDARHRPEARRRRESGDPERHDRPFRRRHRDDRRQPRAEHVATKRARPRPTRAAIRPFAHSPTAPRDFWTRTDEDTQVFLITREY